MTQTAGTTDIAYLTASELHALYAARELSPVDVTRRVLARIEQFEPRLNAFVLVDADRALSAARASEERWHHGAALGPLDGVPVSIKDLLAARGWPTRRGSRSVAPTGRWDEDAPSVARLREAGAVLLGKTTTSEFGLKGMGDSPLTGITHNPWNLSHTPGGSSAGAVVAIAAGFGAIAIGTDGGGSIRVPSAHTGVIGLKPTFGRVPQSPPGFVGVPAHVGPIARSVADLAVALSIISQPDRRDPLQSPALAATSRELGSVRIGYSLNLGYAHVDPEVSRAFLAAVAALREAGATLEEVNPGFASPGATLRKLFAARAALTLHGLDESQLALVDPAVAASAREGEALSAVEYLQAESERIALVQTMARYHADFDLLLTPTSADPAPRVDFDPSAPFYGPPRESLASPFSLTRQPALSIPCGWTHAGLPIGLQIVGRHHEDPLVLTVAASYERVRPFRAPPL
jgi:aspartyl-tRNA(Asn)/glutamyl-tRNA(Gln) amidotransferase subunit A